MFAPLCSQALLFTCVRATRAVGCQPRQKCDPPIAPSNGTQERQLRQPRQSCVPSATCQWHPGTAAAMAPRNGSYNNLAKSLIHQWHPAMAPRNGSYDNLAKVASQWHPAMAAPRNGSSNGTQEGQLRQPRQTSDPPMAPSNGAQERQL